VNPIAQLIRSLSSTSALNETDTALAPLPHL
jgi:hypothetical protein